MPKVKISEYSATANSNTDVASINIDEGCAPSGINNAIRAIMGHLKDFQSGTSNDPFTVGSSGSLTLSYGTANGVAYLNGAKVLTTGSALVFDGTNVGIGNTSPSSYNGSADNLVIGTSGSNGMTIVSGSTSSGYIMFADGTTGQQAYEGQITYDHTNNFMAFNTSGTERMRLNSNGYLFAGSSGPNNGQDYRIGFYKPATSAILLLNADNGYNTYINFAVFGGGSSFGRDGGTGNFRWNSAIDFGGTQMMTLDTSGNLGIGTTSPTANRRLDAVLNANASTGIRVANNDAGSVTSTNTTYSNGTTAAEFGMLGTGYGSYGVLTAGNGYIYVGSNKALQLSSDGGFIAFGTGATGTERARIDSSGNLIQVPVTTASGALGTSLSASGGTATVNSATYTITMSASAKLFYVYLANGDAALVFTSYLSSSITFIGITPTNIVASASPTSDQFGISKSANSHSIVFKTGSALSSTAASWVLGSLSSTVS